MAQLLNTDLNEEVSKVDAELIAGDCRRIRSVSFSAGLSQTDCTLLTLISPAKMAYFRGDSGCDGVQGSNKR